MSINKLFRLPSMIKLLVAVLAFSSTALAQTPPVRIMPLGDSITGSPGCWRALLWDRLQKAGITRIDFVGTQPPQGCSIPYDGDNEGHGGALATSVADQNQLPPWLAAARPDIVLMHFGTNDIWSNRTPAVILTAFSKLVDQMRASNPNMIVLVAQIIPVDPSTCSDCAQRTIAFNAAIPAWAAGKSTTASPIIVVDQWTGFNSATDTSEGVHPNAAGEEKIAAKWFPVLSALLLGQAPAPGFSLSATPPFPQIAAGASGSSIINVTRSGGFASPVTLTASAPAGWTTTFSANPVAGASSTMTIAVPSSAVAGSYPITVAGAGAGAGISSSTTVSVSVAATPTPFFTIFAARGNQTIELGTSSDNAITVLRINDIATPIAFSTGVLPTGITASFSPNPTTSTTSVLRLTASSTAAVGVHQILVVGTGTPGTRNTTINLTVADPTSTPCGTPIPIVLPFVRNGAGEFCFSTSGDISFVNSWNMGLVEINGVSFTNRWSNSLPARINGNYFIRYVATLSSAHFEANGISTPANSIQTSVSSLSFLPTGSSGSTVNVTSNTSWMVAVDQPWLTVTPISGTGNGMITISATANTTPTIRTGAVTLTGGGVTRTVGISQGASTTSVLLLSSAALSLPATAATGTVSVTSNLNWTAVANQPWLTVTPISGANNGTLTINATANTAATARAGTVTLAGGGLTRIITVTQATAVITPPLPCPNPVAIMLPFVRNGEGTFCWVTSGNISFINSWNMQSVEINGVDFTNKWANSFPPRINGNYYIRYVATVSFAHFEVNGTP